MPLFKSASKPAFEHNVKEMMDAGHPQKQSLAAAYSQKRKAMANKAARKRMADGGNVSLQQAGAPSPQVDADKLKQFQSGMNSKLGHMAEGGRVMQAPQPVGGMRKHNEDDSEMQKGRPSLPIAMPDEDDEMRQEQSSSEMNRSPSGDRIKMARYQDEMEEHGMSSSEMDHFAEGGDVGCESCGGAGCGMCDSEYGRGQPGRTAEPEQDHLEEENMRSDADGIRPGGSIKMASYQDEADRYEKSSSEMGHFARGGIAGNPKLEQAYKSVSDAVMAKHKKMADGGDVDIQLNADEEGEDSLGSSPLDMMDRNAAQKENYDEGMHSMFGDDGEDEMHGESIAERSRRRRMSGR